MHSPRGAVWRHPESTRVPTRNPPQPARRRNDHASPASHALARRAHPKGRRARPLRHHDRTRPACAHGRRGRAARRPDPSGRRAPARAADHPHPRPVRPPGTARRLRARAGLRGVHRALPELPRHVGIAGTLHAADRRAARRHRHDPLGARAAVVHRAARHVWTELHGLHAVGGRRSHAARGSRERARGAGARHDDARLRRHHVGQRRLRAAQRARLEPHDAPHAPRQRRA